MIHTEAHEEVILDHLDGRLDEANVTEAIALLDQCNECKELYDGSLQLKSEFQRTHIQAYLAKKETLAPARAIAPPVKKEKTAPFWGLSFWQPLAAAALVLLVVAIPIGFYSSWLTKKEIARTARTLETENAKIRAELARIQDENAALKAKLETGPRPGGPIAPSPNTESNPSMLAVLGSVENPFSNPYPISVQFSEMRGGPGQPDTHQIPKDADLVRINILPPDEKTYPSYRIRVEDNKTKMITLHHATLDTHGNLELTYSAAKIPKDWDITIKVFGVDREGRQSKVLAPGKRIQMTR